MFSSTPGKSLLKKLVISALAVGIFLAIAIPLGNSIINDDSSASLLNREIKSSSGESSKFHHKGAKSQQLSNQNDLSREHKAPPPPPSPSKLGVYTSAAVAADGKPCEKVGTDIMHKNGSAIDATIATLFCVGVVNAQSMGLGGGFFSTYYNRASRNTHVLDARETAPAAASRDMYGGNPELATLGGLAVAVPGEVRGYRELYERHGGPTSWADIIEPTAQMCENGFTVNKPMANALKNYADIIKNHSSMSVFLNENTGEPYAQGDTMRRPMLAKTLRILQQEPDALNNGSLTGKFVQDLQQLESIISREDLENYRPLWKTPIEVDLESAGLRMFSVPPPGSGLIIAFILNILDNFKFSPESLNEDNMASTYQRIIESFKYAYARRTEMGDETFVDVSQLLGNLTTEAYAKKIADRITSDRTFQNPDYYGAVTYSPTDHGTAHVSVIAPNGDAVAVTSTVNLHFGSKIRSESTGIVLNNEMDDFSSPDIVNYFGIPPSPANFIEPGKRPLSSMCPSIFVDSSGDVRLVVGAAGGTRISTSSAWVAIHNIWLGQDLKAAVDGRRLHHQLLPNKLYYEEGFREDVVEKLISLGHEVEELTLGRSVVGAVSREADGKIYANADFRKGGDVDGF